MPKRLFSNVRFNEIKDLMQIVKRPRRIDVFLNPKRRKKHFENFTVEKQNGDARHSKLSWKTDKLHPTLEKLLQDKKHLAAFHTFLQSEFSEENIEFWLACEGFKSAASSDELCREAEDIYQKFIRPEACREINVDHHIREKIKMSLTNPGLSCFDEAQKQVYLLMERDSWPRFLHSSAYLGHKNKSRTLWYL